MKKIGIYGGTFNPVHKGHINCLRSVLNEIDLDRVIILPDRIPPHKSSSELVSGEDRFNMCKIAFRGFENAQVDDWELRQTGKSYSVKTLRHFHKVYPDCKLYFIMGSDMLTSFTQWYCYEEILTLAGLICMTRYRGDSDELEAAAEALRKKGGEIRLLPADAFEVSSSQLRKLIAQGGDCGRYLDSKVMGYINSRGLYRKQEG